MTSDKDRVRRSAAPARHLSLVTCHCILQQAAGAASPGIVCLRHPRRGAGLRRARRQGTVRRRRGAAGVRSPAPQLHAWQPSELTRLNAAIASGEAATVSPELAGHAGGCAGDRCARRPVVRPGHRPPDRPVGLSFGRVQAAVAAAGPARRTGRGGAHHGRSASSRAIASAAKSPSWRSIWAVTPRATRSTARRRSCAAAA